MKIFFLQVQMVPDKNIDAEQKRLNRRIGIGFTGILLGIASLSFWILILSSRPDSQRELHEISGIVEKQYSTYAKSSTMRHILLQASNSLEQLLQDDEVITCAGENVTLATGDSITVLARLKPDVGQGPNGLGIQPYEEFWSLTQNGKTIFTYDQAVACKKSPYGLVYIAGFLSISMLGWLYLTRRQSVTKT